MNENINQNSTWKRNKSPRGNYHNKTETKTTVSLYLNRNLVEKARIHKLNLSRIMEQALNSILDYMETPNQTVSSKSLNPCSLPRENGWARSSVRLERRTLNP
jgi:Post-segregation antitoxin CcdA